MFTMRRFVDLFVDHRKAAEQLMMCCICLFIRMDLSLGLPAAFSSPLCPVTDPGLTVGHRSTKSWIGPVDHPWNTCFHGDISFS